MPGGPSSSAGFYLFAFGTAFVNCYKEECCAEDLGDQDSVEADSY